MNRWREWRNGARARAREPRIRLAIGSDALVALTGDGRVASAPLSLPAQGDAAPAISAALADVAARLGARHPAAVDIALLPPLADVRLVDLPPLDPDEAEAVLQRNASRYFVSGGPGTVVGVARTPAARRRPVLAAAAPAALLEAIHRAVRETGWRLDRIVPAVAAWIAAAGEAGGTLSDGAAPRTSPRTSPGTSPGTSSGATPGTVRGGSGPAGGAPGVGAVLVQANGHVHLVRLEAGFPAALRRFLATEVDAVVAAAGDPAGHAVVIADDAAGAALAGALAVAGWAAVVPAPGDGASPAPAGVQVGPHPVAGADPGQGGADAAPAVPGESRDPPPAAALAAARFAGRAPLELAPASVRWERRARTRRLAARLAAASVLVLVAAAGLELWSVHRDLARVRKARAAIRAEVAPLIAMQDSIARLGELVTTIEAIGRGAPDWTRALADIALFLPLDSHLTAFVASGDTLELEAIGARAGAALEALRGAPSLTDVRLIGMVDRELDDGATTVERFRITARLAPSAAARDGAGDAHAGKERGDQ